MTLTRREFIKWLAASTGAATVSGCATDGGGAAGRVVVIGGGYGGATAAKHVKLWAPDIGVTVVERNAEFVSCPISNLVLGGNTQMSNITSGYEGLRKRGINVVRDDAVAVDAAARQVRLASGTTLQYDRLIVSPGIDFIYDQIPGLQTSSRRRPADSHAVDARSQGRLAHEISGRTEDQDGEQEVRDRPCGHDRRSFSDRLGRE